MAAIGTSSGRAQSNSAAMREDASYRRLERTDTSAVYPLFALRYAAITEPATLPRPDTANPFWRAQERTSALLGAPSGPATVFGFDLLAPSAAVPATSG